MSDPRVERTRAAVLAAAADLLAEEGRAGFTVDAVARRAGVARTTIYRHWPDPGALLYDTFRAMGQAKAEVDTGSVRDDLVALYRALAEGFDSAIGRCIPVLLESTRREPALAPVHRQFIDERRGPPRRALEAGVARGELPAGTDVEAVVDRIAGPVFYRQLVVQRPMAPAEIERLVDDVLAGAGLSRRRPTPAR